MDQLTSARIDLVRRYLAHPAGWPDGIEWKHGDHWYTKNKAYWDALARADVTEIRSPVTENASVTENVTIKKRGRPNSGKALSGAERVKALRAKRKTDGRA
jgi:hypothetical protein